MSDNNEKVIILEREVAELKKTVWKTLDRLREIEKIDAVQTHDIKTMKTTMRQVDDKLDKVLMFINETRGAKKWLFGLLVLIGSIIAIMVNYQKMKL